VEGKGFIVARNLARSDLLVDAEGNPAAVAGVTERRGRFTVYNFEVEGTHTYYAGPGGWWVHNDCTDIARRLQKSKGGEIYTLRGPTGNEILQYNTPPHPKYAQYDEYGRPPDWYYHDVLVRGDEVFDPMMTGSYKPVSMEEWQGFWGNFGDYIFQPRS
jgi:hypothetical protein